MRFIIIGITDAPQPFLPPDVLAVIGRGILFSGGKRHHAIVGPLLPPGAQWADITVPLDDVFDQYRQWAALCQPVIVFASGDPLFFGFAATVRRRMPEAEVVVYPAFNSLQMLAHRLVMPYHDMHIVSLTGRPWPAFDRALIERSPRIGVLTDREHTPQAIAGRMLDYGYTHYQVSVGEHLGHPDLERVTTLSLHACCRSTFAHPNCLILSSTADGDLPQRPFGIPDSRFALLNGRERMITKMPIRLLTLQALGLTHRRVLWDIGFCTGSISIESRLQFPHLHVVAFEIRPECEAIIRENARRHGTPGIEVRMGDFCAAGCESVPAPDAVFIGGHGGRLKEMMAKAVRHLLPGGCIVMNSVTDQSRRLFAECCDEMGLEQAPSLHIALNDYNPIDIMKACLPATPGGVRGAGGGPCF